MLRVLVYLVTPFAIAGLASYPLFLALGWLGWQPAFHKLVLRVVELCALGGLWPLLASLDLRGGSAWGFGGRPGARAGSVATGVGFGFAVGVASLGALVAVLLAAGIRVPIEAEQSLVELLAGAMVAAVAVAVVEEIWFRGGLHSAFESMWGSAAAIGGASLCYAGVHFIRPDVSVAVPDLDWSSGFVVIAGSFGRYADPGNLDAFAALASAGLVLGLVRRQSRRIAECIGIHAGWVLVIKVTREASATDANSSIGFLVSRYDGVVGWLAFAWFSILIALYWRHRRRADLDLNRTGADGSAGAA